MKMGPTMYPVGLVRGRGRRVWGCISAECLRLREDLWGRGGYATRNTSCSHAISASLSFIIHMGGAGLAAFIRVSNPNGSKSLHLRHSILCLSGRHRYLSSSTSSMLHPISCPVKSQMEKGQLPFISERSSEVRESTLSDRNSILPDRPTIRFPVSPEWAFSST